MLKKFDNCVLNKIYKYEYNVKSIFCIIVIKTNKKWPYKQI